MHFTIFWLGGCFCLPKEPNIFANHLMHNRYHLYLPDDTIPLYAGIVVFPMSHSKLQSLN